MTAAVTRRVSCLASAAPWSPARSVKRWSRAAGRRGTAGHRQELLASSARPGRRRGCVVARKLDEACAGSARRCTGLRPRVATPSDVPRASGLDAREDSRTPANMRMRSGRRPAQGRRLRRWNQAPGVVGVGHMSDRSTSRPTSLQLDGDRSRGTWEPTGSVVGVGALRVGAVRTSAAALGVGRREQMLSGPSEYRRAPPTRSASHHDRAPSSMRASRRQPTSDGQRASLRTDQARERVSDRTSRSGSQSTRDGEEAWIRTRSNGRPVMVGMLTSRGDGCSVG